MNAVRTEEWKDANGVTFKRNWRMPDTIDWEPKKGDILEWRGKKCELEPGDRVCVTDVSLSCTMTIQRIEGKELSKEDAFGWFPTIPFKFISRK